MSLTLANLVADFARGIHAADASRPVAVNSHTGASYQPGIGPHAETRTIKLIMALLAATYPQRYASHKLSVPYGHGTRQACDVCLGGPELWAWAIEAKLLRLMGDNGKPNDNMLTHILSPYPTHRSAVTDCTKLVTSRLGTHKAILIYGYDYPGLPMDPAISAFEALASREVRLAGRAVASFDGLIHPVHQRGRVFGWQIEPLHE